MILLNRLNILGIIGRERGDEMKRIWAERLIRWQTKLQQMMRGRYGHFDALNRTLLYISIIGIVMNVFMHSMIVRIISWLILIFVYYRFFSKKIYSRANENTKYLTVIKKCKNRLNREKNKVENRHTYNYFSCPACKQELRAPKGKGKIKVTCSKCQNQFVKKV